MIFGLVFFSPFFNNSESNKQSLYKSIIYFLILALLLEVVQSFMKKKNLDSPTITQDTTNKQLLKYSVIAAIAGAICLLILILFALGNIR